MQSPRELVAEPLTSAAFGPYGEVIEPGAARQDYAVNQGTAVRFDALATVDAGAAGGRAVISIFRAQPRALPFKVGMLERHPLGSQAFVPLHPSLRYIVVVADDPAGTLRAFLATGGQGVNYRRGTWHHPLIALDRGGDFLVVDRAGEGGNCDEARLSRSFWLQL